jgi:hypothetical protein
MKRITVNQASLTASLLLGMFSLATVSASALAKTTAAATSTADQAKVQVIINRGNQEINRRLTTLNKLSSKISSATKLTTGDKATLSSEVTTEISGLTSLKTKLDADTTTTTARADAQSIINDYRVYALIVPKIDLVKAADDQQVAEGKLLALATKLQTRITAAQTAGKPVTSLQSSLTTMNSKISAAQTTSNTIENNVIGLQPSDYNTNHSVLSSDRTQLKTAQSDIQSAVQTSAAIISDLKNL